MQAYTDAHIRLHYDWQMRRYISKAKTQSDQGALLTIWQIMKVNKNQKESRRVSLWNHFEKSTPWSIKRIVAQMHDHFEWQLANPTQSCMDRFGTSSWYIRNPDGEVIASSKDRIIVGAESEQPMKPTASRTKQPELQHCAA
jgi:hypothetical protein